MPFCCSLEPGLTVWAPTPELVHRAGESDRRASWSCLRHVLRSTFVHDILDFPVSQIVDGTVAVVKNVPDR